MTRLQYLFQSVNVLNCLLVTAVAIMAYITVIPFLNPDIQMPLPAIKENVEQHGGKAALPQNFSPVDYAIISEQNLFHPERKIPPEKKDEKAIPRPEVVLYGTLITDDKSIAFIEDRKSPHSTPGRGKRQRAIRKGDNVSGYILQEIEANRIVLVKGDDKIVVMLNDGEKRKASTSTTPQATGTIPSPGSSPASFPSHTPAVTSLPQAAPSPEPVVSGPGATPTSRREALLKRKGGELQRQ